jgi:hypothetical protein
MDWTTTEPFDRLRAILGPAPTTPWSVLIPQLVLWCFRRYCIQHLADAGDAALTEHAWADMEEFVNLYSPTGLTTATSWLTPDNIAEVHTPLEDYSVFFMDILRDLDDALMDEREEVQVVISDMLDEGIHAILMKWLGESPFAIFPAEMDDIDLFSTEQSTLLIQKLAEYSRVAWARETQAPTETQAPVEQQGPPAPVEQQGPPAPVEQQGPPAPVEQQGPPAPVEQQGPPAPVEQQGPPAPVEQQGPPAPVEPQAPVDPPPTSVASALQRRRTIRNGRATSITPNRSSHRRTHRAAVKRIHKLPTPVGEGTE